MKHYISQSFVRKIEVNLANVSAKPTDEFQLVRAYYDIDTFDCELCGHKNCMYAFEVKNLETEAVLKVGSECIHHFENKGVDINLAEGLMRRVMSASNKARRDLKRRLGEEAWEALPQEEKDEIKWYMKQDKIDELGKEAYKALSKEEKRELVVTEFVTLQTKELLADVANNKSILTEEDVEKILALGMQDEMETALEKMKVRQRYDQAHEIEYKILNYIRESDVVDSARVEQAKADLVELMGPGFNRLNYIDFAVRNRRERDERLEKLKAEYGWLLDYHGENDTVLDIKAFLQMRGYITQRQKDYALSILKKECV